MVRKIIQYRYVYLIEITDRRGKKQTVEISYQILNSNSYRLKIIASPLTGRSEMMVGMLPGYFDIKQTKGYLERAIAILRQSTTLATEEEPKNRAYAFFSRHLRS